MKIKSAQLIPFGIAGAVIVFAIWLHALSRKMAERGGPGGPALVEELEWLAYDARVKLGAATLDQTTITPALGALFIDDRAIEMINTRGLGAVANLADKTRKRLATAVPGRELPSYSFPWPRFIYGQVVRELAAEGALMVGFDILFSERRDAGVEVPLPGGGSISSDEFFAREMAEAGSVILAAQGSLLPAPLFLTNAAGVASITSAPDNGVLRRVKAFQERREWHPILRDLAPKVGLNLDGAIIQNGRMIIPRKPWEGELNPEPMILPLNPNGSMKLTADGFPDVGDDPEDNGPETEMPFRVKRIWNLGVVLAAKVLRLDLDNAEVLPGRIRLTGENATREIPVDANGYFFVDWSIRYEDLKEGMSPVCMRRIPEVLLYDKSRTQGNSGVPSPFRGRAVVIGSTATGNNVSDLGSTPLEPKTPLVTKHLNIANSIITGRFVERLNVPAEGLIIALLGITSAVITWRTRVLMASILIFLLCVGYVFLTTWFYLEQRWWVAMVMPLGGGLILPHFALVSYRVAFEQNEQRRVRGIFSRIVSPDVVQELLSAEKLALGGARRKITVYFADVRGFTEFTDSMQELVEEQVRERSLSPEQAKELFDRAAAEQLATVNLYLAAIADTIKAHRGTLDKYMGDCVMAFWGAPIPNERHAACCVRAAVEAQRALHRLNQERAEENERRKQENKRRAGEGKPPLPLLSLLSLGSGINTGYATVGLMGSDTTILNYTVFGREVNLASRLEGVSGSGRIIISHATYQELLRDDPALAATCVELTPTRPKGFRQAIRVYEATWKEPDPAQAAAPEMARMAQPSPASA